MIQFNFFDPILIATKTVQIIDDLLKSEDPHPDENIRQKKLAIACQQYEEKFQRYFPDFNSNNMNLLKNIINANTFSFSSSCDVNHLIIKFIYMFGVKFCKTKISVIKSCQFLICDFSNADFENIQFTQCTFLDCDFSKITLRGVFTNCQFEKCNFSGALLEQLELNGCIFKGCNLNKTNWYRVKVSHHTQIVTNSLIDAAIRFSDLEKAELLQNDLTRASFEGTRVNMISAQRNNWDSADLDGALYLAKIATNINTFNEHLHTNINNKLQNLFGDLQRCSNLLISTGDINTALNHMIEQDQETSIDVRGETPFKTQRFRRFLGWILCALDRLVEYCEHYQKNKDTFNFKISMTNFEILADTLKTAVRYFKYRYLSLYDMCHLSLITESMSVCGIFNNHQQYQAALFKILKADPNFASNPIGKDDLFHKKKKHQEESLLLIQQLPDTFRKIDAAFIEMCNKIIEQEKQELEQQNVENQNQARRSIKPSIN